MRWRLPDRYPEHYVQFLHYFNHERDYYECHEVLEELWLEEGRNPFFQGLLQVAVGLYHFSNGNVNGAKKLFHSALVKLEPFPEDSLGIRLGKLKRETNEYLIRLQQFDDVPFAFYDLTIEIHDPVLRQMVDQKRLSLF